MIGNARFFEKVIRDGTTNEAFYANHSIPVFLDDFEDALP
jgi:hypothetical protein